MRGWRRHKKKFMKACLTCLKYCLAIFPSRIDRRTNMIKKLFNHEAGQAVAEFGLALLILLPLTFWMLRLGSLLNLNHKITESARFAVWEKAYGRDEKTIMPMVEADIKNSVLFTDADQLQISTAWNKESVKFSAMLGMPARLGLKQDRYYVSQIKVQGDLLLGVNFSLNGRNAMLVDPWNLTDRDNDQQVDDDDLEDAVDKLFFWMPGIGGIITSKINVFRTTTSTLNTIFHFPALLLGGRCDIDPSGHPKLDAVPQPSGN